MSTKQLSNTTIQQSAIPKHIAIIMDGNRRWASDHGLPVLAGHRYVADHVLEPLVEHAAKSGIQYLTFWAWSTENWKRRAGEVRGVMNIFRHVIQKRWERLHQKGVRIRIIGDIGKFPDDIRASLERVVEKTKDNTKITVVFALNYGGRDEIVRAINKWAEASCVTHHVTCEKLNHDALTHDTLTQEMFSTFLDTASIPDPDMIVRTGGEERLSGFLLWQSEYSELYFPPWYMPDFTPERLDEVVSEYGKRQRRYGA